MRITNNISTQNALRALQRGQREVAAASERVTTGLRFQRASEDPAAAAGVMRTSSGLRALEQYRRNVDAASARAAAEESVLDQLGNVLIRAGEVGVGQATATASAETRRIAKAEVDQLLRFAVQLSNTPHGDGYLFGGVQATTPPFALTEPAPGTVGFTSAAATGELEIEISAGQTIVASHDGTTVFGTETSGALAALRDLSAALGANDRDAIESASRTLRGAVDGLQAVVGDVGARMNQLSITGANLGALEVTLTTFKADLQEVDFEKAVTELVGRQTAFQAAMLATSRVMGMNLTDYLR